MTERASENASSDFYKFLGGLVGLAVAAFYLRRNGVPVETISFAYAIFISVTAVVAIGGKFVNERAL